MEKYSKAVGGMHPQSGRGKARPTEKHAGRHVSSPGSTPDVAGYRRGRDSPGTLTAEAPKGEGRTVTGPHDVMLGACEKYRYVSNVSSKIQGIWKH